MVIYFLNNRIVENMDKYEIEKKIKEAWLVVDPEIDIHTIPLNKDLAEVGVDSIQLMEFMLEIEEILDITFDEKLDLKTLYCMERLINFIYENYEEL